MILEFTCTATRRPELFEETLATFAANLRGVEFDASLLYLNVDPVPEARPAARMYAIACKFFRSCVVNHPPRANFAAAVKWCFSKPVSREFFHLEDDWLLSAPIDVREMKALLDEDSNRSVINLRAYGHDDERICLAPGLWRACHASHIGERLRLDANPERQLRKRVPSNPYGGAHEGFIGVQFPRDRRATVLKDIGRDWMRRNHLRRDGDARFTTWTQAR